MAKPAEYDAVFLRALGRLSPDSTIHFEDLMVLEDLPATSKATRKKHLTRLVVQQPELFARIEGFFPPAELVIDLIEEKLGPITEANLAEANREAKEIVLRSARPNVSRFVRDTLQPHITTEDVLRISLEELLDFLLFPYQEFSRGAGNGLVSIAGALNEALLVRALVNGEMEKGSDFWETGSNSEGDVVVRPPVGSGSKLGVEVKSYAARERLLRGLADIQYEKVGVGFFQNPGEFNPSRTATLLQTNAAAIYIPDEILSQVAEASREQKVTRKIALNSRFYRPLEQFVTDMRHYTQHGALPPF